MALKENPTRMRDIAEGRSDLMQIDPTRILIEKDHNPRNYRLPENRAHLDSLKESIRTMGVLRPLMCRWDGGQCILVDGECRLTAVLELRAERVAIDTVPVTQVTANNEEDRIMIALTTNTGKNLSDWEAGAAFLRLTRMGWAEQKIASSMGITPAKVSKCIELSDASDEVKQLLSERAISPALAITTIRKKGTKAATRELMEKASKQKSEGKKGPVKKEKAPPASSQFEAVCRAIAKDVIEDYEENEKQRGAPAFSEYLNVKTNLIRKLMNLCNGVK